MNDAAEFLLNPLGFDWQVAQPALVGVLFSNANASGFFTKAQYYTNFAAGRSVGRSDVTNNPAAYQLISRTNIPPVRFSAAKASAFSLSLGGVWTRFAQSGMPSGWTFNTNTGLLNGLIPTTGERTLRLIPYNGSKVGPQMTIQLRPNP